MAERIPTKMDKICVAEIDQNESKDEPTLNDPNLCANVCILWFCFAIGCTFGVNLS